MSASLLLVFVVCGVSYGPVKTLFEWNELSWHRSSLPPGLEYNASNCCPTGIKVYKGVYYVTVPRWKPGVPSTLNVIDPETQTLIPFPSFDANSLDGGWLTYVQSMEIDSRGWMWILDVGRLNIYGGAPVVNLQPKVC